MVPWLDWLQLADDVLDAEEDAGKNEQGDGPPNFVAFWA